ncbi:hypothetical protein NU195Hw_g3335t1 [Hortaea werneckii]
MELRILAALLLGAFISCVTAISAQGSRLLVVLEDEAEKSKYGQFWLDLEERGFQLTYRTPKDPSLSLFQHGVPAYSHLLLLPPGKSTKGLGPNLTPNLVADFLNAGSNVMLALSGEQSVPSAVSSLVAELDVTLSPDRNSMVVDHFNYDTNSAKESHDVLVLPGNDVSSKKSGVADFFSVDGLLAFPHAVGAALGNASPLLSSIIKAPATAYPYNPKEEAEGVEDVFATGEQLSLVTAFQARNSARFTILGSAEALEDSWFDATVQLPTPGAKASKTANKPFAQKLTGWAFKELGVIKSNAVTHHLSPSDPDAAKNPGPNTTALGVPMDVNPHMYRIKNLVDYSISLSIWSPTTGTWTPFTPPETDAIQLEFSMLSPFHRLNLSPSHADSTATFFTTSFTIPDQHGIFNFLVEYRRSYLTNIEEKRTVTIRHFAHDEYPRSFVITAAYPWISGIWMTVAGFVGFVAVWLYSKPATEKKEKKEKEGSGN